MMPQQTSVISDCRANNESSAFLKRLEAESIQLQRAFANSQQELEACKTLLAEQEKRLAEQQLLFDELRQEWLGYKHKAHYWEAQFKGAKRREEKLKDELEKVKATLRKREQMLFGRRSEKNKGQDEGGTETQSSCASKKKKKKRGQQSKNKGPKRRDYGHLERIEDIFALSEKEKQCPCCHLPFEE